MEKLVPKNHILPEIDFSFIYEEVKGLYSEKGRPCPCQYFQNRFYSMFIRDLFNTPDNKGKWRSTGSSAIFDRTSSALPSGKIMFGDLPRPIFLSGYSKRYCTLSKNKTKVLVRHGQSIWKKHLSHVPVIREC